MHAPTGDQKYTTGIGRNALKYVENSKDSYHSSIATIMDTSVADLLIMLHLGSRDGAARFFYCVAGPAATESSIPTYNY